MSDAVLGVGNLMTKTQVLTSGSLGVNAEADGQSVCLQLGTRTSCVQQLSLGFVTSQWPPLI